MSLSKIMFVKNTDIPAMQKYKCAKLEEKTWSTTVSASLGYSFKSIELSTSFEGSYTKGKSIEISIEVDNSDSLKPKGIYTAIITTHIKNKVYNPLVLGIYVLDNSFDTIIIDLFSSINTFLDTKGVIKVWEEAVESGLFTVKNKVFDINVKALDLDVSSLLGAVFDQKLKVTREKIFSGIDEIEKEGSISACQKISDEVQYKLFN